MLSRSPPFGQHAIRLWSIHILGLDSEHSYHWIHNLDCPLRAEQIYDNLLVGGFKVNGKDDIPYTSSTAQGGGGSFKNRKPIGELGCCESGMAKRIHWWTERCLRSPLCLSLSLTIYLPIYLPIYLVCIYLSSHLSLSLSLFHLITYLPIYLSTYLSNYLTIYLYIYLSIYLSLFHLSIYLSVYLSTCLSVVQCHSVYFSVV